MKKSTQYLTAGDTLDMDELLAIADADGAEDFTNDNTATVVFRRHGTRQAAAMPMAA